MRDILHTDTKPSYILPIAASGPEAKEAAQTLRQLFGKPDAVFLLMDLRESRWLPMAFKELRMAR